MEQQPQLGRHLYSKRLWRVWCGGVSVLVLLLWGVSVSADVPSSELFPIPDALRPSVAFWKKVFAELEVTGGLLHDMKNPSIIYETLQQLPRNSQERQSTISGYRDYYQTILFTLASGKREDLSSDEARVLAMFQGKDSAEVLYEAASSIRFQGGMRERFMQGIIRSGAYRPDMERIFASFGLPVELTYLPHVESSFENRALSKVGAAGVWQIMPATGRRFLTVNGRVDERLDIQAATTAAAQIFQENYEHLGTWPLAITAYNHGLYGMKQAVETMGTKDFGVIFQSYRGPLFGFASQNFYAEFLAAKEVAQNYTRYFGDMPLDAPAPFSTMVRYQSDNNSHEERNTSTTLSASPPSSPPLREPPAVEENKQAYLPGPPAMRQSRDTFSGDQSPTTVPAPVVARQTRDSSENRTTILVPNIPETRQVREAPAVEDKGLMPRQTRETVVQEARSIPPVPDLAVRQGRAQANESKSAAALPTSRYQVQSGDTLTMIAQRFRTTVTQLSDLNDLPPHYMVKRGETLAVPTLAPEMAMSERSAAQVMAKAAVDNTAKKPEDAILRAIASKAVPVAPPPPATKSMSPEVAMPEKVAPHVVAKATVEDTTRKSAVDKTGKRPVEDAPPKAVSNKAMPLAPTLAPATKSTIPETPMVVALATAPKATMTKAVTPETAKSVGTSAVKVSANKTATPALPIPVMFVSAAQAATVKPAPVEATKPGVATPVKAISGKSNLPDVAKSAPVETSKSVSSSPAKLVATRVPVTQDVPKPTMLTSVTKTSVSTRMTTRRLPPKGT